MSGEPSFNLNEILTRRIRKDILRLFDGAVKKRKTKIELPPLDDYHKTQRYLAETMSTEVILDWKFMMNCFRDEEMRWWFELSCSKTKPEAQHVHALMVIRLLGGPSKPYDVSVNCSKFRWAVPRNLAPRGDE